MIVHRMAQRTPEWYAVRAGKVCGSEAEDALGFLKSGKETAARRDLRMLKLSERMTGRPAENGYINEAMQRGIDCEPHARAAYEAHTGVLVDAVGFIAHDDLAAGCSPDGLVAPDGMVEIKCPKSATHVRYLRTDGLLDDYQVQVTHGLWLSERAWCDLVSWDDRLPPPLHLLVRRVWAKDLDLAAHEAQVRQFLKEVNLDVASLQGWRLVQGAA